MVVISCKKKQRRWLVISSTPNRAVDWFSVKKKRRTTAIAKPMLTCRFGTVLTFYVSERHMELRPFQLSQAVLVFFHFGKYIRDGCHDEPTLPF
jgi:hypothetical protein